MNTIYTWGYGKQVWEMLRGVSFFVQNEFYMVAIAFAIMLFMLIIRFMQRGQLDWQIFLVSLIVVQLFLRPSAQTFNIVDEATGYGSTISNIPMGLGILLAFESQLEKAMLQKVENSFSTPNGIQLQNAGMGFSFIAPLEMMNANPADKYLQLTFTHWMNNCFLYDIAQGNTDLNTISNTTDLLANLAPTVNYETLVFDPAHPKGVEQDCRTAYSTFKTRLSNEANNYLTNILPQKLNMAGSGNLAAALTGTRALIHQASTTSAKWVEQEMMRNMLNKGFKATATITGGEVATTAWSAAAAKAATNQSWRMTGIQAKNNLPVVRAIGIALLIGVSVIVAFYAVASLSFKALYMVLAGFITLGLWSPIAALINYQVYRRAEDALASGFGTLSNSDTGLEQISTYAANLEWWYGVIPLISYMLITGGGMSAMYLMRDAASGASGGAGINVANDNTNYRDNNNNTHREEKSNHQSSSDHTGDYSKTDSYGSDSIGGRDTNVLGNGYKYSIQNNSNGGRMVNTSSLAGDTSFSYDRNGNMMSSQWKNSNITNAMNDTANASVSQARQAGEATSQSFSQDLSYALNEAQTNGIDIKDTQSLSNHFGVDTTTAKSTVDAVKEAEEKSLKNTLSSKQIEDIEKESNEILSFGADGNFVVLAADAEEYSLKSIKTGETYSNMFENGQYDKYTDSKTKSLSKTLSSEDGILTQYANSIIDGNTHVNNKTKVDAENYSNTVSQLNAATEQSHKIHTQTKTQSADLNGNILNKFINMHPTLSDKFAKAGSNLSLKKNIQDSAASMIDTAIKNPSAHSNDYKIWQDSLESVTSPSERQEIRKKD